MIWSTAIVCVTFLVPHIRVRTRRSFSLCFQGYTSALLPNVCQSFVMLDVFSSLHSVHINTKTISLISAIVSISNGYWSTVLIVFLNSLNLYSLLCIHSVYWTTVTHNTDRDRHNLQERYYQVLLNRSYRNRQTMHCLVHLALATTLSMLTTFTLHCILAQTTAASSLLQYFVADVLHNHFLGVRCWHKDRPSMYS